MTALIDSQSSASESKQIHSQTVTVNRNLFNCFILPYITFVLSLSCCLMDSTDFSQFRFMLFSYTVIKPLLFLLMRFLVFIVLLQHYYMNTYTNRFEKSILGSQYAANGIVFIFFVYFCMLLQIQ